MAKSSADASQYMDKGLVTAVLLTLHHTLLITKLVHAAPAILVFKLAQTI
jgi:hypothetical protein